MSVQMRVLAFFLVLMVLLIPGVSAWDDCPRGLVNDPYPGRCSLYIDTNNDGICDHSQPEPVGLVTSAPVSPVHTTSTIQPLSSTVPVTTQKAPIAPFPVVLLTVCAGLFLFLKRR